MIEILGESSKQYFVKIMYLYVNLSSKFVYKGEKKT